MCEPVAKLTDGDVWLCCLPDLAEIIVENTKAGDDEAIVLAFLPRELRQRHRVAAAIGQCNGFEIETTRRVRAGWLWFLRKQQVLPPATHSIEGRDLLPYGEVGGAEGRSA